MNETGGGEIGGQVVPNEEQFTKKMTEGDGGVVAVGETQNGEGAVDVGGGANISLEDGNETDGNSQESAENWVQVSGENSNGKNTDNNSVAENFFQSESELLQSLEKTESFFQAQEQVLLIFLKQLEENKGNVAIFDQLAKQFDTISEQVLEQSVKIKNGIYDFPTDTVYAASEKTLILLDRIDELIANKKDIQFYRDITFLKESELNNVPNANSNQKLESALDDLTSDGSYTEDEIHNTKKRFKEIQEFAGMTLDTFIELNEGSSLETFLAFLHDPINTNGRDGLPLKFGKKDLNDGNSADIIPLPQFRTKFKETKSVGKALSVAAEKINSDWAVNNRTKLDAVRETGNPKVLKELFLDLYTKHMVNSDKRDEFIAQFRLHFGTALFSGEENKFLNDASFDFFVQKMQDEGRELDKFWNIKYNNEPAKADSNV